MLENATESFTPTAIGGLLAGISGLMAVAWRMWPFDLSFGTTLDKTMPGFSVREVFFEFSRVTIIKHQLKRVNYRLYFTRKIGPADQE